jgi:hypothetical protein
MVIARRSKARSACRRTVWCSSRSRAHTTGPSPGSAVSSANRATPVRARGSGEPAASAAIRSHRSRDSPDASALAPSGTASHALTIPSIAVSACRIRARSGQRVSSSTGPRAWCRSGARAADAASNRRSATASRSAPGTTRNASPRAAIRSRIGAWSSVSSGWADCVRGYVTGFCLSSESI